MSEEELELLCYVLRAALELLYWFRPGVVPSVIAPCDRAHGPAEEELVLRAVLRHLPQAALHLLSSTCRETGKPTRLQFS